MATSKTTLDEARIYFLAKSAVENSADPSDALIILLSGPLSQLHGHLFDSHELSRLAQKFYGWTISSSAIEFLMDRMRRRGWLESRTDFPARGPFYVNLPDPLADSAQDGTLENLRMLGKALHRYAKELSPINALPKDEIESATLLLRYAVSANAAGTTARTSTDADYLCGRFIEDVRENDLKISELIGALSSLGFLSVVSDDLANPKSKRKVDLRVIVDGPIILDYLESSGKLRAEASQALFEDLRSIGCQIITFDHCVREAQKALRTVLKTERYDRYGPTGDALRRGIVKEDRLKGLLNNFDVAVRQSGITIMPDTIELNPESHQFFNSDKAKKVEQIVNWHDGENDDARFADADTITLTIRRRRGHRTSDLFDSKFVAVTTNDAFVGATRRYLVEGFFYNENQIPPVISLQELSAKVWLEIGENNKKREKLASSHLLLACERSVKINRDVVEKAKEELSKFNPEKLEQFELLLRVPRSARAVVDRTLNNASYVSGANIETLVEAAIHAAADEVSKAEKRRRQKLGQEYEAKIAENLATIDDERLRRESAEQRAASLREQQVQIDQEMIEHLEARANIKFRKHARWLRIVGLIIAPIPFVIFLTGSPLILWRVVLSLLVTLGALLTAMNFPGHWLTKQLKARVAEWAERQLRESGRFDLAERVHTYWDDDAFRVVLEAQ